MRFILLILLFWVAVPSVYSKDLNILSKVFGQEADRIDYDNLDKSPDGLIKYKVKMSDVHYYVIKLDGNPLITSTITFKEPVALEDLIYIVEQYEIAPSFLYVFAKDQREDEIVTVGFKVNNLESFKDDFSEVLKSFEQETGFDVLGITAILGYVPKQQIQKTANDDKIFLLDITADRRLSAKGQKHKHHFGWELYHNKGR